MSQNKKHSTIDCEALRALLPAYSINALDEQDRQQVQDGLNACPELAEELAQLRGLHERLLYSAPLVRPSSTLKAKILKAAAQETPAVQPLVVAPVPRRRFPLIAAVLLIALLGSNLFWIGHNLMRSAERVVVIRDAVPVSYVTQGKVNQVALGAQDGMSPNAVLSWVSIEPEVTWIAWLVVRNFPALQSGEVYSLWISRTGESPLLLGQFMLAEGGETAYMFQISEPIRSFDLLQITTESSPAPTAPLGQPLLAEEL